MSYNINLKLWGCVLIPPENEKLEPLGNSIFAITSKNHTFGADAVLLENFAVPRSAKQLCDLCSGCGIVSLLWSRDKKYQIDAVEIQKEAAELARRAANYNNLTNINVIETDLRLLDTSFNGIYDLVACNPPYKKAGTGKISAGDAASTARHETLCTLEDVVTVSARSLKGGGRFCICHRPERLTDIIALMRSYKVEPKRIKFVQQRYSAKPWLLLVEGKKFAKPSLIVEPTLIVEDENGKYTKEMNQIYRYYNH